MINHVNSEIFDLCSYYHQLGLIQHQDFAKNHKMNKELRAFLEKYYTYEYQRSTATGK